MTDADHPEPQSLRELQAMDAGDFAQVDRYLWGDQPSVDRVIRHIIELAAVELEWQGEQNANSLRDFWYNPTKPILERAFPEKRRDPDYDFNREMSKRLSGVLSDKVKAGEVTYRELNILDDSRSRKLKTTHSVEADKLLFVEKDAAYRKLEPLSDLYEISLVSGGGYQATALIEDLAYHLDDHREYDLFVLSDYDPNGFEIAEDFRTRAETLGINIGSVQRVGINPDQVNAETLETQRFTPPVDSDADRDWMDEYGINGRYGLELEAVGGLNTKGRALRQLVVEALRPYIRERERIQRDLENATENAINSAAKDVTTNLVKELHTHLREAAAKIVDQSEVGSVEVSSSDGVTADIDLDRARAVEDAPVPRPYDVEALHEAAIDGGYVSCSSFAAKRELREHLKEKIATGEIPVEDLLDVDYDGGRRR